MLKYIISKTRISAKTNILKGLNGEYVIGADGRIAFLIEPNQNTLTIIDENNQIHKYKKDDILEVKIEDENEKGYKRNVFSTLALYKVGKIIDNEGGLQKVLANLAKEKEVMKLISISIVVVVKDFANPFYNLLVFENGMASNKKAGYALAMRWYSLINVMQNS